MNFETYQKLLNHIARKFSKNPDQYDDLRSEFYVLFLETKDKFDPEKSKYSSYLYMICKNHALNIIKKQNKFIQNEIKIVIPKEKEVLFEMIVSKYTFGNRLWAEIKKGTFFDIKLLTNIYVCSPTIYRMKKILRKMGWDFYETEHAFHELKMAWGQIYA